MLMIYIHMTLDSWTWYCRWILSHLLMLAESIQSLSGGKPQRSHKESPLHWGYGKWDCSWPLFAQQLPRLWQKLQLPMLIKSPPAHPHRRASFSLSGIWLRPQFLPFPCPPSPSTRSCAQAHPNITKRCSWGKQTTKARIPNLWLSVLRRDLQLAQR